MHAYQIQKGFGLENLVLVSGPEPAPAPGQVLLKMRAVSLNYRDLLVVQGVYNARQPLPLIPLSDGVGEVMAVGDGVSRVKVGDRVCPIFAQRWLSGPPTVEALRSTLGSPYDGTLAELAVFHEDGLVHVPTHLTDEEAATLPCAAVTAWSGLVTMGGVKAGDTVLVQGTGGVSVFGLQIARMLGARVIATTSREEKEERLRTMGAWDVINYAREPKWGKVVRERTDGAGVDHILEVGGANTLSQSLQAIRVGGTVSLIGVLSGTKAPVNILPILMQNVTVQGVLVGHRESFEAMNRAIDLHRMKPEVNRVVAFEDAVGALEYLASGRHVGKVVIRMPR